MRITCLILVVLGLTPVTDSGGERILNALQDEKEEPDRWLARLEPFSPYPANWIPQLLDSPHTMVVIDALEHVDIVQADDHLRSRIVALLNSSADADVRTAALRKLATSPEAQSEVRAAIARILTRPDSEQELVSCSLQNIPQTGGSLAEFEQHLCAVMSHGSSEHRYLAYVALGKMHLAEDSNQLRNLSTPDAHRDWTYQLFHAIRATSGERQKWCEAIHQLLLHDIPVWIRIESLRTLVHIAPDQARTAAAILSGLDDRDAYLSQQVADLLSGLDGNSIDVVYTLSEGLPVSNSEKLPILLGALSRFGPNGAPAAATIVSMLEQCHGQTDHFLVAHFLTTLRQMKSLPNDVTERIVTLLSMNSPLYRERPQREVVWLRAYVFATLADVGVPDSTIPHLVDAIANADSHTPAIQCGAAVRAVAAMGERAESMLPYLLDAFGRRFPLNSFSLDRYDTRSPENEVTNVEREILRAFEKMNVLNKPGVIRLLQSLAVNEGQHSTADERLRTEASRLLTK